MDMEFHNIHISAAIRNTKNGYKKRFYNDSIKFSFLLLGISFAEIKESYVLVFANFSFVSPIILPVSIFFASHIATATLTALLNSSCLR